VRLTSAASYAADLLGSLGLDVPLLDDGRPSDPIGDWAGSGAMWLTGEPDGPPRLATGAPATAVRGGLLALGSVAAAVGADAGRLPDERLLAERAASARFTRAGRTSAGGATRLLTTADADVAIALPRECDRESVPALIEAHVAGDPWAAVADWCALTASAEVVERAALLGMAAARLPARPPALAATASPRRSLRLAADRPLTVIDLSALWAGPLCAHLLHLLGARVTRIESPHRPDPTRTAHPDFYDLLHDGTAQRRIDLRSAEGRDDLRRLLGTADIVIEASRARALRQLGIDAEAITAEEGVTWLSITAYGRADNRIGFGDDVAVGAGLVGCSAPDAPTVFAADAIADPLTGVHAALVGYARALSGRSGLVDIAMHDVAATAVGPVPPADVVARDGDWYVDTGADLVAVAGPTARSPARVLAP
jgi:hypothetical protein